MNDMKLNDIKMNETKVPFSKILLIIPNSKLELMLITPAIKALKKGFPGSEIHAVVNHKEILENNPSISRIFSLPKSLGKINLKAFSKDFIALLRNENYDLSILFDNRLKNVVLSQLIRAKNKAGPNTLGLGFFMDYNLEFNSESHIIDRYQDALQVIKPISKIKKPEFFLTKHEIIRAKRITRKYRRPRICINAGASINRSFPTGKWATLADEMIRFHNARILFIGNIDDRYFIKEIISKMKYKKNTNNLSGEKLRDKAAIIKESDLYIGSNTEFLHIARALETPLIGLFGPNHPDMWGYHDLMYRSIRKHKGCEFCENPDKIKTLEESCLKEIEIADIIPVANELLRRVS